MDATESPLGEDAVEVTVIDRGIGIARENQGRVFEKFHTLPSSGGTGQTKGTGLGLTICRKIVEAHGGTIWVESDAGRGSIFHFTLPLQRAVIGMVFQRPRQASAGNRFERRIDHATPESAFETGADVANFPQLPAAR